MSHFLVIEYYKIHLKIRLFNFKKHKKTKQNKLVIKKTFFLHLNLTFQFRYRDKF